MLSRQTKENQKLQYSKRHCSDNEHWMTGMTIRASLVGHFEQQEPDRQRLDGDDIFYEKNANGAVRLHEEIMSLKFVIDKLFMQTTWRSTI